MLQKIVLCSTRVMPDWEFGVLYAMVKNSMDWRKKLGAVQIVLNFILQSRKKQSITIDQVITRIIKHEQKETSAGLIKDLKRRKTLSIHGSLKPYLDTDRVIHTQG